MLQSVPTLYTKPSDALYCYIYDSKTSTIGKLKIKNYTVSLSYRGDGRNFSFKSPKSKSNTYICVEEKYIGIMRFNRVYLYEDNDSKALGIIYKTIDAKATLLESKSKDLQSQALILKTKPHDDIFKNYWED